MVLLSEKHPIDITIGQELPPTFHYAWVILDSLPVEGFNLAQHIEQIERRFINQALEKTGGKKSRAAELLGMSFRSFRYYSFRYYMKKYDLG